MKTKQYAPTVAKSARMSAHIMNELLADINNSQYVHEFGGALNSDPANHKLITALANTNKDGHASSHAVERAGKKVGGTSAAHELLKFGATILADTLSINAETEKILKSLVG